MKIWLWLGLTLIFLPIVFYPGSGLSSLGIRKASEPAELLAGHKSATEVLACLAFSIQCCYLLESLSSGNNAGPAQRSV